MKQLFKILHIILLALVLDLGFGVGTSQILAQQKNRSNQQDVDDISDELEAIGEIIKLSVDAVKLLHEELEEAVAIIKDDIDTNQQTKLVQEYYQEIIDDEENGLTDSDREKLQAYVDDKDAVKESVEKAKEAFKKGEADNVIRENLASNFAPSDASEDVAEEAPNYNDKTLFQKILLELRCAYVNNKGKQQLSYLSRLPLMTVFRFADDLNTPIATKHNVYLELINEDSIELDLSKSIQKEKGEFERGTFNSGYYTFKYKFTYDNLVLYTNQEGIDDYLKPDISDIRNGFDTVWQQIQLNDGLSSEEVQLIRTIAACDATFFKPKSRYDIIKAIYSYNSSVVETTEDLMLDLMSTCQKKDATAFLTHFSEDFKLFKDLYGKMDEDEWWYVNSNENNNTRFLTTLYALWKDSEFSNPNYNKYSYKNAPKTLMYDDKSLLYRGFSFREVDFELNESTKKIDIIKIDPGDLDDQEQEIYNYAYHIFQPISLVFVESENAGKFGGDSTPAFFYMGLENLEDLKARRAAIGLTIDVALTFSGIGNLAHLSKLSKGYKIARVTIAGLEIGTTAIDLVISYSSACDGNEEFCKKIQAYNFWLQMATFSSDVVVNRMVRRSAKEALESSTKSGVDEDLIKHLERISRKISKSDNLKEFRESLGKWRTVKRNWTWDEYFINLKTKYPAEYEKMIGDYVASSNLTSSEAYSIFSTTTIFHQVRLNKYIREGKINNTIVQKTIKLLDRALNKMPVVPSNVKYYRGVGLSGKDLENFIAKHKKGEKVTYYEYTYAANNRLDAFINDPEKNIKIFITSKKNSKGRTIHGLSFGKAFKNTSDEAMFMRNTDFLVEDIIPKGNDIYEIYLIEK